jgi:multidrug efflux pump
MVAPGRMVDPSQFENIILRAEPNAAILRIKDVARVELGAQTYTGFSRLNGKPSANVIVYLSPGSNATDTADKVQAFVEQAKKSFPAGIDYVIPYNSTMFVRAAIKDVLITLLEAIGLVILVVFLFLQSWRATLIPLLTVPVAVVGTFALFPILGFSINITNMFGLVLAIGIVVDDAIVVVESVQRHIDDGMSPKDATIQAMAEVSAPVVAIAFILAAVFIPVAFLGGISGQIYKQFALTIAVSVLISAFSALSLSPALTRLLLKPKKESRGPLARAFGGFNRAFDWTTNRYLKSVGFLIRKSLIALVALGCFWLLAGGLFKKLPTGFLPDEDQGAFFTGMQLPDGASVDRADAAAQKIEKVVHDIPGVANAFVLGGLNIATGTTGPNMATVIATLKPWDERTTKQTQLQPILGQAFAGFAKVPEALTLAFGLPPILGLSTTGGFQFMLEDRVGVDVSELSKTADALVAAASKRPELANVISTFRSNVPAYSIKLDPAKLQTMDVPIAQAYQTMQAFIGGVYANDFNAFGHTWQVIVQAEPQFRSKPEDINRFYARSNNGNMVPLGTVASVEATTGPDVIYRYNRFRAVQILGGPAPGYSSGEAVKAMEEVSAATLPSTYSYEWTGTTYQQKLAEGSDVAVFGFAAVLVFLFLAALYESWSIPFAVVLAVPIGIFGALLAVDIRAYPYDIYTQIGIVTLIGLSAKNAILIVEFARERVEHGLSIREAVMEAAHLRLRPILMTSFAFILGVLPLVIASGASSGARRALGTAVFGGMLASTLLAVFIVPVLFVVIENFAKRKKTAPGGAVVPEVTG